MTLRRSSKTRSMRPEHAILWVMLVGAVIPARGESLKAALEGALVGQVVTSRIVLGNTATPSEFARDGIYSPFPVHTLVEAQTGEVRYRIEGVLLLSRPEVSLAEMHSSFEAGSAFRVSALHLKNDGLEIFLRQLGGRSAKVKVLFGKGWQSRYDAASVKEKLAIVFSFGPTEQRQKPVLQASSPAEVPAGRGGEAPAMGQISPPPFPVDPSLAKDSLTQRIEPEYPPSAWAQGIRGPVVLRVVISPDGAVESAEAVSGPDLLVPAAIAAVQQWRYRKGLLLVNGKPVETSTQAEVDFQPPARPSVNPQSEEPSAQGSARPAFINCGEVQDIPLFSLPNAWSAPLGRLECGEKVLALGQQQDWVRVQTLQGIEGYAHQGYVSYGEPSSSEQAAGQPESSPQPTPNPSPEDRPPAARTAPEVPVRPPSLPDAPSRLALTGGYLVFALMSIAVAWARRRGDDGGLLSLRATLLDTGDDLVPESGSPWTEGDLYNQAVFYLTEGGKNPSPAKAWNLFCLSAQAGSKEAAAVLAAAEEAPPHRGGPSRSEGGSPVGTMLMGLVLVGIGGGIVAALLGCLGLWITR